jgi:urocanate hydratase
MLVEGGDMTDATGNTVEMGKDYGLTVEINGKNFYFRDQPDYCDETAAMVMKATSMENQLQRLNGYKDQK